MLELDFTDMSGKDKAESSVVAKGKGPSVGESASDSEPVPKGKLEIPSYNDKLDFAEWKMRVWANVDGWDDCAWDLVTSPPEKLKGTRKKLDRRIFAALLEAISPEHTHLAVTIQTAGALWKRIEDRFGARDAEVLHDKMNAWRDGKMLPSDTIDEYLHRRRRQWLEFNRARCGSQYVHRSNGHPGSSKGLFTGNFRRN